MHACLSDEMYNLAVGYDPKNRAGVHFGLQTAMKAPYFMYQMLAYSACHIAHTRPAQAAYYEHQAVVHQTRAISLFSELGLEIDRNNCVPTLLFSSILGMHMLADTLRKSSILDFNVWIEHYVQYAKTQAGIHAIATSTWPMLMESELASVLSLSKSFTSRQPSGNDCAQLHQSIAASLSLTQCQKRTCQSAIDYLQVGLDVAQATCVDIVNSYQMICEWAILVPNAFTDLLTAKNPEALVILAYYAILLDHGRHLWQVQNAGKDIFDMISDFVGPYYRSWLDYPRTKIHGRNSNI